MELDKCIDCTKFQLRGDQSSAEKMVNIADKFISNSDPLISLLATTAYRGGMSGIGERSCSAASKTVFATARCSSPEEFIRRR